MAKLTNEQSFDFYLDVLESIGMHMLTLPNNELEYQIFEECSMDFHASLSKELLDVLEDNGYIDENIVYLSKDLQSKLLMLKREDALWNAESLKVASEWRKILQLSDKIKELIHQKWSDEELEYLRGNK